MPKPREYINEQGWKIVGAVVLCGLLFLATLPYKTAVKAQETAEAATEKLASVKQNVEQMSKDVEEIKVAAKEISKSYEVIKELVIKHDEALKYDKERHENIEKRLERLEE